MKSELYTHVSLARFVSWSSRLQMHNTPRYHHSLSGKYLTFFFHLKDMQRGYIICLIIEMISLRKSPDMQINPGFYALHLTWSKFTNIKQDDCLCFIAVGSNI